MTARSGGLIPEIFEVGRDFEIVAAHKLNDALQVIFLFPGHADLPVLQRALHLETRDQRAEVSFNRGSF